jgi:hypothetical protein
LQAGRLAGKTIVISADIRAGANFSGSSIGVIVATGTGVDETLNVPTMAFATGSVDVVLSGSFSPTTAVQRRTFGPYTVPSGITELGFRFAYSPVGTAGIADYFEITNVKLEIGSRASDFEFEPLPVTLAECRRFYRKSFRPNTMPHTNVGTGTGELTTPAVLPASGSLFFPRLQFDAAMDSVPIVTFFNPRCGKRAGHGMRRSGRLAQPRPQSTQPKTASTSLSQRMRRRPPETRSASTGSLMRETSERQHGI